MNLRMICFAAMLSASAFAQSQINVGGVVIHNPTPEDFARHGRYVTNSTTASVTTNYPANYAAKLTAVTNFVALAVEAGVYGLGEEGADAKLDEDFKKGTQAQKNDALRVSLKLLRAKLALERLGVDPLNATASIAPQVVTNPAAETIEWVRKSATAEDRR